MLTKIYENPAVYRVDVPLPDNPLKNLNCYVVQDSGETLIIDTGFNRKECLDALLEGLAELDADWEKTNLFLTHLHADHTGLAPTLMKDKPGKMYMSRVDYAVLEGLMVGEVWKVSDANFIAEGFTQNRSTSSTAAILPEVLSRNAFLMWKSWRTGRTSSSAAGSSR